MQFTSPTDIAESTPMPPKPAPFRLQRDLPGTRPTDATHGVEALVACFAPRTAFEAHLATEIAGLILEQNQLRDRKHMIMWQKAIQPMFTLLTGIAGLDETQSAQLARAWAQGSDEATAKIISLGIDPDIAHNEAYVNNIRLLDLIDTQIERLERRRRNLFADYRKLRRTDGRVNENHTPQIDDAEVLGP